MKTTMISILLLIALSVSAQTPSKKDCYKPYRTTDTTVVAITWRDTTSVMHFHTGFVLTDALSLTCLPKVYDTVYSTKVMIIEKIRPDKTLHIKELDYRLVINLQEIKK